MKNYLSFLFACFFAFTLGLSVAFADADLSIAGSAQCDEAAFMDALGASESGGDCGGGNQYNCIGPVIKSGMHKGDTPLGKYQFMPKTLADMGISTAGFVGNQALQEQAIRTFTQRNDTCLRNKGAYDHIGTVRNGVRITKSGLLGAAHLGGCGGASKWASGGSGPSDQLGTSLADYAGKFQDYGIYGGVAGVTCGGGVANAADAFAQAQAKGLHNLIGCDPEVLEEGQKIVDALNEAQIEAAKAIITKPNPLGVTGCEDQHHNIIEQIMGEFSNFGGGNQSLVKNVKEPHAQHTGQFFGPQNIAGTMTSALQQAFVGTFGQAGQNVLNTAQNVNNTVNNFASSLGGLFGGGGGNASKDCGLQEDAWLIAQCIEMPQIPSLSNILGGKIAEIQGAIQGVADLANPERLLQKVCSGANDKVKGLFGAATDKFKDAADAVTTPITDSAASLTN
jgi:hypothetical protein